jgi:plasmid maintenance system antidote protein VapI
MAAEVKREASVWTTIVIGEVSHRRPSASRPQGALAEAIGVQREHVNDERRAATAPTALILARVFGNSPDFWLNVQRRSDLWESDALAPRTQADRTCATLDGFSMMGAITTPARPRAALVEFIARH